MEKYGPSEITRDDLLELDDPGFGPGNVALVTGAAAGIGRATALAFAANGLTVVGADLDADGLEAVADRAAELSLPGEVVGVEGDLADADAVERIVDRATDVGTPRYLINNAGIQHIASIEEFPMETYDRMHAVMLRAPLLLTKLCLPHFRNSDDGTGVVGNMCSVHGHIVTRDKVAYNTLKFGLRGLTQSIAAEGEGDVRSFTVSTAYVKTGLVARQLPDTAERRGMTVDEFVEEVVLQLTRTNEMMEPYEVANLFVMGCSEHSDYLDGGDMTHDGGMSLTY